MFRSIESIAYWIPGIFQAVFISYSIYILITYFAKSQKFK